MTKFLKSSRFPDVNVWMALTFQAHVNHQAARQWFDALDGVDGATLSFCRITQLSFLRLATTAAAMRQDVLSRARAWAAFDRWFEDDRVMFLEEPHGLESVFRAHSRTARSAPKQWSDAYLLAFAEVAGLTLVTFDRALKQSRRNVEVLR